MTDKELIEEYGDINNYIKDEVYDYKKDTTDFMDGVKLVFFAYLLNKASSKDFNDEIDRKFNVYQELINKRVSKGTKNVRDLVKSSIEVDLLTENKKTDSKVIRKVLEQFKLDNKSTKTADDKYIKVLKNYYNKTKNTLDEGWVQEQAYLSKKVSKFDKIEKTVAYRNNDGTIRAYFDIASYDSMVYNTNLTRSGVQESLKSCEELSEDVVYVDPHMFSCDLCQDLQGKFYSITGKTKNYKGIRIDSLDEAMRQGLLHPNCTHIPRPALIDDEVSNLYSGEGWSERYSAKQKKQSLELKKQRLRNDNIIYKKLGDEESIDKNKQKINALNKEIRKQKELMNG